MPPGDSVIARLDCTCNLTVYVGIRDGLGVRSSPTYRRVYTRRRDQSFAPCIESRFRGQKSTHSTALVYKERRLSEPGLTGARLNSLAQPALVYKNTVLVTEWVNFFLSQLTNVNLFSKGETTKTATELACFMVSD